MSQTCTAGVEVTVYTF